MQMTVLTQFEQNMSRLLPPLTKAVLVAFSGGADSSLLLRLTLSYCKNHQIEVHAAHVNHGIRGEEATRDQLFCENTANEYGIPCHVHCANVPALAEAIGDGIEEVARSIRYQFFEKVMLEHNIPVLLTAHNADDQLETILFRMTRGTGLDGLCGIPESRPLHENCGLLVLRPILRFTKSEILETCSKMTPEVSYITDSTNADVSYTRNRIRHLVVPQLEKITAKDVPQHNACSMSQSLQEDVDYLNDIANHIYEKCLQYDHSLSVKDLRLQHSTIRKRVVRLWLSKQGISFTNNHIQSVDQLIMQLAPTALNLSFPGGKTIYIDRDCLYTQNTHEKEKNSDWCIPFQKLIENGEIRIADTDLYLSIGTSLDGCVLEQVTIPIQTDDHSYQIRLRKPQDKIYMHNMHYDVRKKLSEARVPLNIRNFIPILCKENTPVWVPFIGISHNKFPYNKLLVITLLQR